MISDIRSQISEFRLKVFKLRIALPFLLFTLYLIFTPSPTYADSQCPEDIFYPDIDQGETVCVHKYGGVFNNETGKCDYAFDPLKDLRYCSCNDDYYYPDKDAQGNDACYHKHGGYFDGSTCQYAFDLEPDTSKCSSEPTPTPTLTPTPTITPTPTPADNPEERAVNNLTRGTNPLDPKAEQQDPSFLQKIVDGLKNLLGGLFWTPINKPSTFYGQSQDLQVGGVPTELVPQDSTNFLDNLSNFLGDSKARTGVYTKSIPGLPEKSGGVGDQPEVTKQERDFEKAHFPQGIYPITEGL